MHLPGRVSYALVRSLEDSMRVFTSVFVVDSVCTSFAEMEEALRSDVEHSAQAEEMDASLRHRVKVCVKKDAPRDCTGERA